MTVTVTLDTNCINAQGKSQALNSLEEHVRLGHIRFFKTDVVDTELADDAGAKAHDRKEKSQFLSEHIGVCVLDHSRLDHTRLGDESTAAEMDELARLLFQRPLGQLAKNEEVRSVRDVMHLHTHIAHGSDFFVTTNVHLLRKSSAVERRYGTAIVTPERCLEIVDETVSAKQ